MNRHMKLDSVEDILRICRKKNCTISEVMLEYEMKNFRRSREEVLEELRKMLRVMKKAMKAGLKIDKLSSSGLSKDEARVYHRYRKKSLSGNFFGKIMERALATSLYNSRMGLIVACPTAGACGVLPAALITTAEKLKASEEAVLMSMLTAAGIGLMIKKESSISGAAMGCQGEIGAAGAMAAAAIVELKGGTPEQCCDAASFALKCILGMVCDAIAGSVEVPCIKRNALVAGMSVLAADLALAGVESRVPLDEVIRAMNQIGHMMNYKLRETAIAGLAGTKTGRKVKKRLGIC